MIDIIFPAFNRLEFTRESMETMLLNTDWSQVRNLVIYDDGSTDGTREYLKSVIYPVAHEFVFKGLGGPVAIMKHYLSGSPSEIFGKIDNDVILPPQWLEQCLDVMGKHPELDLLGIEAFCRLEDGYTQRTYKPAAHIGGIGFMRSRCFRTMPEPQGFGGRFGFTQWQRKNKHVVKGWINPSLPVFLLDKLPIEPWFRLSSKYLASGWQRRWASYDLDKRALWDWWSDGVLQSGKDQ
jgi:glycosyltransferase involved in cell wall biosynthesis